MQLEGTLDKFPLRELIEMVIYSSVTGVLELRVGAEIGRLFFRDGRPYHALSGERAGIDAVTAMFEERDAPFRFVADRDSAEMTLWMDPWEMLDRGEAQALKWAAVRQHIASVDCVPTLLGGPPSGQIQISESAWPVLAAVDGQRTIREIAEHLNWVLFDTCTALVSLMIGDLIALQPARPSLFEPYAAPGASLDRTVEPSSTDQPAAEQPHAEPGFLERMLAEAQAKEQQRPSLTDETQDGKRVYRYRYVDDRR